MFLNYQSAFRAVNGMFNSVADGIYTLSGGLDAVQSWLNSLSQAWNSNPNWFSSLWNLVTGGVSSIVAGLITLIGYLILPFAYTLFTLFYALYGSILYVVGPFVLALMPSRGLGQLGRTYFVNMMIFQCWGLLRNPAILMSALQITDPMRFNGSWLQAFAAPAGHRYEGQRVAADHGHLIPLSQVASSVATSADLMTVISGAMTAERWHQGWHSAVEAVWLRAAGAICGPPSPPVVPPLSVKVAEWRPRFGWCRVQSRGAP